jgi:DNA-binding Lrp family transcriptional regulator
MSEENVVQAEKRSVSAFVLLSFEKGADAAGIFDYLHCIENVMLCEAVNNDKDFDIVMLLQADEFSEIDSVIKEYIKDIEGLRDICILDSIGTVKKGSPQFDRPSSFVILKLGKDNMKSVFKALEQDENIVFCDHTNGRYDAVLLVQGPSFAEIDRNIAEKISCLAGVADHKNLPITTRSEN